MNDQRTRKGGIMVSNPERAALPLCTFPTVREAADNVLVAAEASGYHGLHALPFNRFDRQETTWWLSPSPGNPGYRHGKIMFTRRDAAPGDILVGLAMYRETPKGRRYVMDPTWFWDRFRTL